jgi:hypothetical protein
MMKIKTFLAILFTFLVLSACAKKTALEEKPTHVVPANPTLTEISTDDSISTNTPAPTDTPVPSLTPIPPTATEEPPLHWDQAKDFIGEVKTVCGPVKSAFFAESSEGQPTFLNVGKDYPDPGRFSVIIWGEDRANFPDPPEQAYLNQTICITGEIQEYDGIAEIFAEDSSQITQP